MTRREDIIAYLETNSASINELAEILEVSQKNIADDLEHVFKTLKNHTSRLLIRPAQCLNLKCEFVFSTNRKKIADPSRCPKCHSERIQPQSFKIEN